MAFSTLTLCQLFHAFDVRSETTPLFRLGVLSNKAMNKAFLAGAALRGGGAASAPAPPGAFSGRFPGPGSSGGWVLALALTPWWCARSKRPSAGPGPGEGPPGKRRACLPMT